MVTSSLCADSMSISKRSNEEIISPVAVKLSGGPSKKTRQSTKKVVVAAPGSTVDDILQGIVVAGK